MRVCQGLSPETGRRLVATLAIATVTATVAATATAQCKTPTFFMGLAVEWVGVSHSASVTGCESVHSDLWVEGCGLRANCENRGQRPQLQWRRRRLVGGFGWVHGLNVRHRSMWDTHIFRGIGRRMSGCLTIRFRPWSNGHKKTGRPCGRPAHEAISNEWECVRGLALRRADA